MWDKDCKKLGKVHWLLPETHAPGPGQQLGEIAALLRSSISRGPRRRKSARGASRSTTSRPDRWIRRLSTAFILEDHRAVECFILGKQDSAHRILGVWLFRTGDRIERLGCHQGTGRRRGRLAAVSRNVLASQPGTGGPRQRLVVYSPLRLEDVRRLEQILSGLGRALWEHNRGFFSPHCSRD